MTSPPVEKSPSVSMLTPPPSPPMSPEGMTAASRQVPSALTCEKILQDMQECFLPGLFFLTTTGDLQLGQTNPPGAEAAGDSTDAGRAEAAAATGIRSTETVLPPFLPSLPA